MNTTIVKTGEILMTTNSNLATRGPLEWGFVPQDSYTKEELIACGRGELFGPGNARLPLPPMLMFDRIIHISKKGGEHGMGFSKAEKDINPKEWFFGCHFEGDPVMPGCLGLDAMWQLTGFFPPWMGATGVGRAIGCGEAKFSGQILPFADQIQYQIHVKNMKIGKNVSKITSDGYMYAKYDCNDWTQVYYGLDLVVLLSPMKNAQKPFKGYIAPGEVR